MNSDLPRLTGAPARIFISVDESTHRSTLSFMPAEVGAPIPREDDGRGEFALSAAREIAASYPGCTIVGPHFHTSRPDKKPRRRR
jgi:hypothetical protein